MNSDLVVRAASASDFEGIWPLTQALATSYTPQRAAFDTAVDEILKSQHALLLVAQDRQQTDPIGYLLAHTHPALFANGPIAWVEELMVHQSRRRAGVGRQLIHTAEQWAQQRGAAYVALATRRAEHFYQALGYENSAVFYRKPLTPLQ